MLTNEADVQWIVLFGGDVPQRAVGILQHRAGVGELLEEALLRKGELPNGKADRGEERGDLVGLNW